MRFSQSHCISRDEMCECAVCQYANAPCAHVNAPCPISDITQASLCKSPWGICRLLSVKVLLMQRLCCIAVPADIDASKHTCSTCLMQRLAGLSHRLTFCEMDRVAVAHYALHIIWPQPSMASSMIIICTSALSCTIGIKERPCSIATCNGFS